MTINRNKNNNIGNKSNEYVLYHDTYLFRIYDT